MIRAVACAPRVTAYGIDHGIDVDVAVTIDGATYYGEVTLAHSPAGWVVPSDTYDDWVSSALLDNLRRFDTAVTYESLASITAAAIECALGHPGNLSDWRATHELIRSDTIIPVMRRQCAWTPGWVLWQRNEWDCFSTSPEWTLTITMDILRNGRPAEGETGLVGV
jgi:hypothetical protein